MKLIRKDLADLAREAILSATEWPQYTIFLYIPSVDTLVLAPRTYSHGHLYSAMGQFLCQPQGIPFVFRNDDLVDGYVEWDEQEITCVRSMLGEAVETSLEQSIRDQLILSRS